MLLPRPARAKTPTLHDTARVIRHALQTGL